MGYAPTLGNTEIGSKIRAKKIFSKTKTECMRKLIAALELTRISKRKILKDLKKYPEYDSINNIKFNKDMYKKIAV